MTVLDNSFDSPFGFQLLTPSLTFDRVCFVRSDFRHIEQERRPEVESNVEVTRSGFSGILLPSNDTRGITPIEVIYKVSKKLAMSLFPLSRES
jgi:hypothetical protein